MGESLNETVPLHATSSALHVHANHPGCPAAPRTMATRQVRPHSQHTTTGKLWPSIIPGCALSGLHSQPLIDLQKLLPVKWPADLDGRIDYGAFQRYWADSQGQHSFASARRYFPFQFF